MLAEVATAPTRVLRFTAALLAPYVAKAAPLTAADFEARFSSMADDVDTQLADYAQQLADGDISPAEFRQYMTTTLRTSYTAAYRNGMGAADGGPLSTLALDDSDRATVLSYFQDELGYVDNFARAAQDALDAGTPFSADYLLNRTGMYADALRGLFWAGQTNAQDPATQITWIAHDDKETCDPCQAMAEGSPYSPDELDGKMPGADTCDGLDSCRCELRYETPDTGDEQTDEDTTDYAAAAVATLRKGFGDPGSAQTQDEHGRFTSGSEEMAPGATGLASMLAERNRAISAPAYVLGMDHAGESRARDYITTHGHFFKSARLPSDVPRGPAKMCYMNATQLALAHPDWSYAEGFARQKDTGSLVFMHAWAVKHDGHTVVDPTWPHPEQNDYFGVTIPRDDLMTQLLSTGVYGVFAGKGTQKYLDAHS